MSIDPWSADLTLAEISAASRRNRHRIGQLTVPLVGLAILLGFSSIWVLVVGRDHLAAFYAPGLVLVAGVSGRAARRDAAAVGVQVKVWPWVATALVLLVLSAAVSRWAAAHDLTTIEAIGPSIVFAAGIAAFGLWTRAAHVAVAGFSMMAASLAATTVATGDACVALQLVVDAAILVIAVQFSRLRARR